MEPAAFTTPKTRQRTGPPRKPGWYSVATGEDDARLWLCVRRGPGRKLHFHPSGNPDALTPVDDPACASWEWRGPY